MTGVIVQIRLELPAAARSAKQQPRRYRWPRDFA